MLIALKVKVAVVQTKTYSGSKEPKNMHKAVEYIKLAADSEAEIVCFPETYPGPWKAPVTYSPIEILSEKAKEHNIHVIAGTIEPMLEDAKRCYNVLVLIDSNGKIIGRYRRTTPLGPWIYRGGRVWDFRYQEADELPVFNTQLGKIGLLICSEVYVPELSRILALKGAEIVFMPAGASKRRLVQTWRNLIWSRAIENLMYTATCQNIFEEEDGLAMIASPEEIILESKKEGVFIADLDLNRIRWLRETEDRRLDPQPWRTKPGVFKYWRRPEMYKKESVLC